MFKRIGLALAFVLTLGSLAYAQTASITAKPITVNCTTPDKIYDGNTTAPGTTCVPVGVIGSDVVSVVVDSAAFATKQAGTGKTVTVLFHLTGTDALNYSAPASTTTTASILRKKLTVSVVVNDKVYDATPVATISSSSLNGTISGDSVSLDASLLTAAFADKNVGANKPVTVSGTFALTGVDASNYTL